MEGFLIFCIVIICLFIYFIPSILAFASDKKQRVAILLLNIFLGWTILGWIIALIWAAYED